MPPELTPSQSEPVITPAPVAAAPAPQPTSYRPFIMTAVILFAIAAIFLGGLKYYFSLAQKKYDRQVATLKDARAQGNYKQAAEIAQDVVSSALSTEDQKAIAILNTAAGDFRMTNNPRTMLAHIPAYKEIVENENLSMKTRIIALNQLASSFCGSGRTWDVYQEIYKGGFYEKFLVPGDPDASSRNLFTYSYNLYPTTEAAIFLARSYASDAFLRMDDKPSGAATSTFDRDIQQSKIYLKASEERLPKAIEADPTYPDSSTYATYLYWHAYTSGLLAHWYPEEYGSQYKKEYEDFIARYATSQDKDIQYHYLAYAYLLYSNFLIWNDNDTAAAAEQLTKLIALVKTDPYYDTNQFVRFVHNERVLRTEKHILQGPFSMAMAQGQKISPEFKAFVDSIK